MFSVYITLLNQWFPDKSSIYDITAFFNDIIPLVTKYGEHNVNKIKTNTLSTVTYNALHNEKY